MACAACTEPVTLMSAVLAQRWELHPQVAVRPEPFGALAYHYGNRRLVFLRHPDMVRVVQQLAASDSVQDALVTCGVSETRWPSFVKALASLRESEVVRER
jgi:mycofactocin biosynthesis protein MftB